jgi:hypothetical protein
MRPVITLCFAAALSVEPLMGVTIVNPGFEMGSLSGWSNDGNWWPRDSCVGSYPVCAQSGTYYAYTITYGGSAHNLWQDIATAPGVTYNLSFWYHSGNYNNQWFRAYWNEVQLNYIAGNNGGWHRYTFTDLPASSGSTTRLRFEAVQPGSYSAVDSIVLSDNVSTPEPGTCVLVGAGLAAVLLRRRAGLRS